MKYKRITAHRALTLLRYAVAARAKAINFGDAVVTHALDEVIGALDAHVRRSFTKGRKR